MSDDDLENIRTLEQKLIRVDVAIQDDQVRIENLIRDQKHFAQLQQDVEIRLEARKTARTRIADTILNLYQSHHRKRK